MAAPTIYFVAKNNPNSNHLPLYPMSQIEVL